MKSSAQDTVDTKYVAFVRAINVGGHAIVKMADLSDAFAAAGCKAVRTYIQSGNVIFEAPESSTAAIVQRVQANLRSLIGGEPGVFFRTAREIERMMRVAPFKDVEGEPGVKLYVAFLSAKPAGKLALPLRSSKEALEIVAVQNHEAFIVSRRKKNGFYSLPNLFIEKELGVAATTRNMSTLGKLVDLMA